MQPGQFFTEYLDSLPKLKRLLHVADSAIVEATAARARENGVIFTLPAGGVLTDRKIKSFSGDLLRPPYKYVILEYVGSPGAIPAGYTACPKRVVIAIDMGTFVSVLPCLFNEREGRWIPHIYMGTFSYTDPNVFYTKGGVAHIKVQYDVNLPVIFGAIRQQWTGTPEALTQQIASDLADEMNAYIDFCYVLHHNEVTLDDVLPDKAKNKMRRALGKTPLFTYKVLTIGKKKRKSQHLGGTHASPRSHLRRGYYRTSQNGVRHWVQPCMVKGDTDGFVHKDYKVEGTVMEGLSHG
jgi:hypothetical protein